MSEEELRRKAKIEKIVRDLQYDETFSSKIRKLANELYKAMVGEA